MQLKFFDYCCINNYPTLKGLRLTMKYGRVAGKMGAN